MSKASVLEDLKIKTPYIPRFVVISDMNSCDEVKEVERFMKTFSNYRTFAVRSSANVEDSESYSYAGIFDTFLNISKNDVIEYVKRCFESVNDKKVMKYRNKIEVYEAIEFSVIIQEMIDSEVSGVLFTKDPITERNINIIECVFGQCDGVVSGFINPDRIEYDFNNKEVLNYKVSFQKDEYRLNNKTNGLVLKSLNLLDQSRRKLDLNKLQELTIVCNELKKDYRTELDIEWCFSNQQLYILQARPITITKDNETYE